MIVTLCLNPTLQKTLVFNNFSHAEVNRAVMHRTDASGKGVNVSRVLSQLGAEVLHITQLGGRNRAWFTELLLEDGIPLRCVPSPSEIRGCYTILEENPFCMTELVEEGEAVSPETEVAVRQAFMDAIASSEARAAVISGSKAKGFSSGLFADLAYAALEKRLLCVADYRGSDLLSTLKKCSGVARGLLVIKPNFEEFCFSFFPSCNREDITDAQLCAKMAELYELYGCKSIVTRGSKPVRAFDGKQVYTADICPLPEGKRVLNTIGCGDSFTAGFTAKTVAGASFAEALAEANRCGALNAASIKPGSLL